MASIRIVLVELRHEGNIGAVARAMRNFGLADLVLVRPCPIGDEARKRAMGGLPVLESARVVGTLDEALQEADVVVGTSGIDTWSEKRFLRISVTPRELRGRLDGVEGTVALLFGREDFGLRTEELARCDLLVTIPASPEYPILNVSHAAVVLLYELRGGEGRRRRTASGFERGKLWQALDDLLQATVYPAHKRPRTRVMFRRLVGRAVPTKWEFHALMGVLNRATRAIRRLEGPRGSPRDASWGDPVVRRGPRTSQIARRR